MTGPGRRFDPAELRGGAQPTDAEFAEILAAARELEALAARDVVFPTADFDDHVMAAIAAEAPPRLIVATGGGFGARMSAFVGAVVAAWRVATSGGRPALVRAQALAFVLLVVVAGGSLASVAAIGAANLLSPPSSPLPTVAPLVTAQPTPTDSPEPSSGDPETAQPTTSPEMTDTPEVATSPDESGTPHGTDEHVTAEPTKTPKPTAEPTKTPKPTRTPRATETPEPDESEEPEDSPDDHGGSGGGGEDHGGEGSG